MMPPVPEGVDVDPVLLALLHCAAFLDLAEDDIVDPEAARDVLEHVGMYIQRLAPEQLQALSGQLDRLADHGADQGWPEWITGFVGDFLYSCGIGEDRDDEAIPATTSESRASPPCPRSPRRRARGSLLSRRARTGGADAPPRPRRRIALRMARSRDAVLMVERTAEAPRRMDGVGSGLFLLAVRMAPEERSCSEQRLAAAGVSVEARTEHSSYARDPEGNRVRLEPPSAATL